MFRLSTPEDWNRATGILIKSARRLERAGATALTLTPGTQGTAVTVLRPSGKARFADHVVDVVTEGEFIAPQTPVMVLQTDGMRVVVKSAHQI